MDLPPGWRAGTLNDVVSLVRNGIFARRPADEPVGVPILRISAVRAGRLDLAARKYVTGLDAATTSRYAIKQGDLLFTRYNGSRDLVGRCARVPEHDGLIIHPDKLIRAVPRNDVIDGRFLALLAETQEVRRFLEPRIKTTAGQSGVTGKDIRDIPVRYPSLAEQWRIVDILEDHLSRLDAARAAVDSSRLRLSRFRQSMLQAVLDLAGSAPGCSVRSIGEIAQVGTGATPLKARRDFYEGGTIPWVTSADLAQGLIECPTQFITPRALDETNVKIFPPGTLLVAMYGEGKTRGTVGELAVAATTNQACAAIRLNDSSPSHRAWVRMALEANYWQMRRLASGGVQPNLNLGLVRQISIPFPDVQTQDALLRERVAFEEARRQLAITLERVEKRESSLRRALLDAAFSGRLTGRASDMDRVEELAGV
ncbi:restriction endonuclease subunit S [Micromonospora chersina]|uniref:restriction endonuclease subunit S n=1 Tax=Micromonospora chersina TaxID=47854 RepID=UPI003787745E